MARRGEFLEHHAVLLHALDEFVGTGANRAQSELVAGLFGRLGRHHHPRAIGELRDQRRVGRLQCQLDGEGIDDVDVIDRRQLRLSERARKRQVALQRKLCSLRSEGLAVVKLDAGPELDGDFLAVGRRLVAQCELRHDVELFVDVEQLVAERCEHDAADIGARHGRVEDIRILGEPDPQRGLGLNGCPERQQQRRRGDCQTNDFHCCHPLIHDYAVGRVPDISAPARPAPSVPPLKAATNFSSTGEKPPSAGTIFSGAGNSAMR